MDSCSLVVSHTVARDSQPHVVLQCPLKGAVEMPALGKYSERIGYHPLECNVLIKSETPIWCCDPSRKGTRVQG